ncbi:hypothetical protein [Larkinella rosea]|uniref:hypothetical protein n=1 Tax=Larkinella rosea TaxID=2025312 RepID=UPI001639709F|nr:hypothetical protein [Larkinella rosea]
MNENQLPFKNRFWLKVLLIAFVLAVSVANIYLSKRPKHSVSYLELSTLELLSEFDDY